MSIPAIKFLFQSEWKQLDDALKLGTQYEAININSADELAASLSESGSGLIISSLCSKNDLIQLATFMKLSRKKCQEAVIKIVVVNFTGEKQIEQAIDKLGILDVVDPHISTKALKYKIDFWMKSISAQLKKSKAQPVPQKTSEAQQTNEKKSFEQTVIWANPLEIDDDMWLLLNEQDCKKVLSRWLIRLYGPSPYAGQWVDTGNKRGLWRFHFSPEVKSRFIIGKGEWFFEGSQKPEFIWRDNIWHVTGTECHLFYEEGSTKFTRLKIENKIVTIAKNSDSAQRKEQLIEESFNKEILLRKEESVDDDSDFLDARTTNLNNLQGKGKTSHLDGKLSGKVSESEEPLKNKEYGKGSTSHIDGNLRGKVSENEASKSDAHGKGSTSHFEGHLGGKVTEYSPEDEFSEESEKMHGKGKTSHIPGLLRGVTDAVPEREKPYWEGAKPKLEEATADNVLSIEKGRSDKESKNQLEEEIDQELLEASSSAEVSSMLSQNARILFCDLNDFFDNTIIFTTPLEEFSPGSISMDLKFDYQGWNQNLVFEGQVVAIDADDEGLRYISVTIPDECVKQFDAFMKLYALKQKNTHLFMKYAKGL